MPRSGCPKWLGSPPTIFDSVGFALEGYSALEFVRDTAAELGIGDIVELVPQSADPKNLFGLLSGSSASSLRLVGVEPEVAIA
jgi:hypothetical protein